MAVEALGNELVPTERIRTASNIGVSQSAPASPKPSKRSALQTASDTNGTSSRFSTVAPNPASATIEKSSKGAFHPDASLVLVGIRGCGKRSLGFIAAAALGRRFITEDHYFQSATGLSRQDYLQIHGSQEFHKCDVEVSRKMLDENRTQCVIECGLGSLTSSVQDHLRDYALTNPVVYLMRDMEQIKDLLKLGDRSARLLRHGDSTHRRCSNFEFYNIEVSDVDKFSQTGVDDRRSPYYSFKLIEAQEDFSYFVRFITGNLKRRYAEGSPFSLQPVSVDQRLYTHALEIQFSDYEDNKFDLAELESGGDVLEIRVDKWSSGDVRSLSRLVALARRKIGIPITLAVSRQAGFDDETRLAILRQGLRLGVEFLGVDLRLESRQISALIASRGSTRIIGTFIDVSPSAPGWDDVEWLNKYTRAQMLGCDLVRLLRPAMSREDNEAVKRFVQRMQARGGPLIPLIAYNTGLLGRTSQMLNETLTSVTYKALKRDRMTGGLKLAPSISAKDAVQALSHVYLLDPLKFFLFGGNVSSSLSPIMHNSAYRVLGLRHTYQTKDTVSLAEIDALKNDIYFGGASIAQPLKVKVVTKLSALSRHAEAIGAVNTLLPLRTAADGTVQPLHIQAKLRNRAGIIAGWYGDNTDWIGISVCMNRNLSPRNVIKPSRSTGLVVGAGGMARAAIYALLHLGCRNIFIFNRTISNAETVAAHFNKQFTQASPTQEVAPEPIRLLRSRDDPWPSGFELPTMIISCVAEHNVDPDRPAANFELPLQWLQSPTGGVVIEMAYARINTPLQNQVKWFRDETNLPWVLVSGLGTLPEQAIAQFELMTGRKAPRDCMRQAIIRGLKEVKDLRPGGEV